jgi:thiol-disulfide isomerase/thioredoxin
VPASGRHVRAKPGCRPSSGQSGLRLVGLCLLLVASQAAGAVGVGDIAPNFQLPAVQDARTGALTLRLLDLRGKVVYLDFWASWCGPCKQSFPWMNEVQARYGARGLEIVAVNLDTRSEDARSFLAALPPQFRVAFDAQGMTPRQYGIRGMPTSLLLGPDGKVLLVHSGFRPDDKAAVEAGIEQALTHLSN